MCLCDCKGGHGQKRFAEKAQNKLYYLEIAISRLQVPRRDKVVRDIPMQMCDVV
jgi:hypothetical protein